MHLLFTPSYYTNSYNPSDGIYFKVQAEALQKNGIKIGIIAPIIIKHYVLKRVKKIDFGLKEVIDPIPTFIFQFPSFPVFKRVNDFLRLYYGKKLFRQYLKKYGRPDLIHLQSFENGILTRWIKEKYGIKFLITEHSTRFERNDYSQWLLKLAKKAFKESELVITVSPALGKTLHDKFKIDTTTIPNLIDTSFFRPLNLTKKYDLISIGGLRDVKNYSMLLDVAASLKALKNDISLIIIGVGPLQKSLQNKIMALRLESNVFLIGHKTPADIVNLLNQSRLFVSSSKKETFGVAIVEAMSCGLPVVATKSGGPESFLTEDYLGVLTEQSTDKLYEGIRHCLEHIEKFNAKRIHDYIDGKFSERIVSNQLISIYRQLIK